MRARSEGSERLWRVENEGVYGMDFFVLKRVGCVVDTASGWYLISLMLLIKGEKSELTMEVKLFEIHKQGV